MAAPAAAETEPAAPPPATADDATPLDDPVEPFVPLRPRSGRQEDHIRALALFAAGRVAEQKQDYETALRNYQRAFRFDPTAVAALRRSCRWRSISTARKKASATR